MPILRPTLLGAAVSGAASALARSAPPALRVTRHRVPWPELSRPVRVLHLSDVHVGWSTPERILDAALEAAEAARPDLVALTGDYVNHSLAAFSRMEAFVRRLPGEVVAVLGNHDHFAGAGEVEARLAGAGARVLRNARFRAGELDVVGVDDGFTRSDDVEAAFSGLPVGAPALVLTHFPPTARAIARRGGRLVLAGHTHAGQLELPGDWTERLARWALLGGYLRGEYELEGGARLYVNAGLGHARRGMRRGETCRPEAALFELTPDAPSS